MQETVYDKLKTFKQNLFKEFALKESELFKVMSRLSTWHYPKKRSKNSKLSKQETMIYQWILNRNYKPATVYNWLLACNTNKEVQERLKSGTISLKKAMRLRKGYKALGQVDAEFLYQIKIAIQKYVIR